MKGFPNQVPNLAKLTIGMRCIIRLLDAGEDPRNDGVLGPDLVRAGVAGTGHSPMPVEKYLREQLRKKPSDQSFRTTARGLRELFRLLGFIDDRGARLTVTDLGQQAAALAGAPMTEDQLAFWRRVIRDMTHAGPDGEVSHPYQVLLRLVARKPGITRAMCALALEARNDSPQELDRIVALADLPEEQARERVHATESNWDNAKKILPSFAEQLHDVVKKGQRFTIAHAPGEAEREAELPRRGREVSARAPRTAREVTPETIGQAGIAERSEEIEIPPHDPAKAAETVRLRGDRLRRHNLLVRQLAERLSGPGRRLFEDPFDIFLVIQALGILIEVKTLDGSEEDERRQVRIALAQLLYYEAFVMRPVAAEAPVHKIACFERPISEAHRDWLNRSGIGVIWCEGGRFRGDRLAVEILGAYLKELR